MRKFAVALAVALSTVAAIAGAGDASPSTSAGHGPPSVCSACW